MYRVNTFAILLLLLSTSTQGNRRVTVVRMITERTTSTTTIPTNTFCFLLSSDGDMPITPCRRRRQHWIEEPIIFALEDQIEEDRSQFIVEPSQTFQVEPTPIPAAGSYNYVYPGLQSSGYESLEPSLTNNLIESSVFVPVNSHHLRFYFTRTPLFFSRIWQYITSEWYRRSNTETVTFTRTRTVVEKKLSFKTSIIGISGCTPNPLPYDVCPVNYVIN